MSHTQQFSLFFALLAIIGTCCQAQGGPTCETPVAPYSKDLFGKSFAKVDDCYRPSASYYIDVYEKMFVAVPVSVGRDPFTCTEYYVFHFRQGLSPFIFHYPKLKRTDFPLPNEMDAYCASEQKAQAKQYFPGGETKESFTKSVSVTLKLAKEIRQFECVDPMNGMAPTANIGPDATENVALEQIIAYLYGLAYQYSLCV